MDSQVVIVGAGPVGLWLAGELRLAGARSSSWSSSSRRRRWPAAPTCADGTG